MRKIEFTKALCCLVVAVISPAVSSAQKRGAELKVGVGVKISSLGIGFEAGVPLLPKLNVRAGGNFINYSHTFNKDGVQYAGNLSWRSGEASVDWFPFGGFHVSPGLLFYNGNKVTANALVPGGNTFTLSGNTYMSSASDPIIGNGQLTFAKVAPKITVGFGNLVPRNGRHWSIMGEMGVAYQGSPTATLALQGTACDQTGTVCFNTANNQTFQNNVAAEQTKINNSVSFFKFYPIVSLGFGFNF